MTRRDLLRSSVLLAAAGMLSPVETTKALLTTTKDEWITEGGLTFIHPEVLERFISRGMTREEVLGYLSEI